MESVVLAVVDGQLGSLPLFLVGAAGQVPDVLGQAHGVIGVERAGHFLLILHSPNSLFFI